ncbi:MAG: WG repeat-containing protein [Candidatus Omnitrophica bacterium]|nr:WG repeat-containing protein [Candidatus Omnitrophota bacterium]MBU1997781.1 WG repeat-containing protein [Candidatus Omnitrophota bacterium]MBU4334154.1 WG repeat-containing protein [Candidatus Omnitrophota bacterium]
MGIFDFIIKKKGNTETKVSCQVCGSMILPATAKRTGGLCGPCFNLVRYKPPFVGDFHDGLATVQFDYDAPIGFVNKDNVVIIEPRFSYASDFSEGLACVRDPESFKYGYIDKTGDFVIKPQFKNACDFNDGLASFTFGGTESWCGQRWGFIDRQGNVVINPMYLFKSPDCGPKFCEGLAAVALGFRNGEAIEGMDMHIIAGWDLAYIDKKGDIVIPGPFEEAFAFKNGLATVVIKGRNAIIRRDGSIQL